MCVSQTGDKEKYNHGHEKWKVSNATLTVLVWVKALSKGTNFAKNAEFLEQNADISKVKTASVLKDILSETTYACVLKWQVSSLQHNSKEF